MKTIAFGLVTIPVKTSTLTREERIPGKYLCPCHREPAESAGSKCRVTGQPIEKGEVQHGYAVHPKNGPWVEVDTDALKLAKDQTLALKAVIDEDSFDNVYVQKQYQVKPDKDAPALAKQAFDVLAAYLRDERKVVVGETVWAKDTQAVALRWSPVLQTVICQPLWFDSALRRGEVAASREEAAARPEPEAALLAQIGTLFETSLEQEFDPSQYVNEFRERHQAAIDAAAQGKDFLPAKVEDEVEAEPPVDLMAALTASVEEAKKKPAKKAPAKKRPAKKAA